MWETGLHLPCDSEKSRSPEPYFFKLVPFAVSVDVINILLTITSHFCAEAKTILPALNTLMHWTGLIRRAVVNEC